MVHYIRSCDQFTGEGDYLIIPINQHISNHPTINPPCAVVLYHMDSRDIYVISINHSDLDSVDVKVILGKIKGTKYLFSDSLIPQQYVDAKLLYFLHHGQQMEITVYAWQRFYRKFNLPTINQFIPLVKWVDYAKQVGDQFMSCYKQSNHLNRTYDIYSNGIRSLRTIERNKIAMQCDLLQKHFNRGATCDSDISLVYSQYHPFNATGRPSNTFDGINFAALNKHDGTRQTLISRYDGGHLIEFDYSSYHIHIVANLIGYHFEHRDVHTYFAKQYFNTQHITREQYEQSKEITFKALYSAERPDIPFFHKVSRLVNIFWSELNTKSYVVTPIAQRKIYAKHIKNINRYKLFNYIIQATETELNYGVLHRLNDYIYREDCKLVLYTYDSFLFDSNDLEHIKQLYSIISDSGKYPCKVKAGVNYADLQTILI